MKINYSEKIYAILSYTFLFGFISCFRKNKSSFLKCHLRKGKFINLVLLSWLIFVIIMYRAIGYFPLSIFKVVKITLYVLNIVLVILILVFQMYWIIKIIKKKD